MPRWLSSRLTPSWRALHAVAVMAGAAAVFVSLAPSLASAKTPGATYCYYGTCHRVKTLTEMQSMVGRKEIMHASHYDDCSRDRYNPCGLTSSGERFRPHDADNAASPIYPDGTTLLIRNPQTEGAAVVRVNNAGPYWGKRKLDVSIGVARKLGFAKHGVARLEVRVLSVPTASEARYRRNRSYDAVPGYIGQFANADSASAGYMALAALEQAGSVLADTGSALTKPIAAALLAEKGAEAQTPIQLATAITQPAVAKVQKRLSSRVAKKSKAKGTKYASKRYSNKRRYASRGKARYAASHLRGKRLAKRSYGKHRYASARVGKRRYASRYASSRKYAWRGNVAKKRGYASKKRGYAKGKGRSDRYATLYRDRS